MSTFTDDMIQRSGLPDDVFTILHDCAYLYVGCPEWYITNLMERARQVLSSKGSEVINDRH